MRKLIVCLLIFLIHTELLSELVIENSPKVEADANSEEDDVSFGQRVKDTFSANLEFNLYAYGQYVPPQEAPIRMSGEISADAEVELASFLRLYLDAFAIFPVGVPLGNKAESGVWIKPYFDVQEFYAKFHSDAFNISIGRLVVPWRGVLGVELNNRLNPLDFRRGVDLLGYKEKRIPQFGFDFQTNVDKFSIEFVAFINHLSSQGSLLASEQGGFQIGDYQNAFFINQADFDLFSQKIYSKLPEYDPNFSVLPTLGLKLNYDFGRVDLGVNAVLGYNSMPRIFTRKYYEMPYASKISLGFDLRASFKYFILKAEGLFEPKDAGFGGRSVLMASLPRGELSVVQAGYYAFALGLESSFGDKLIGGVSIVNSLWQGLPVDGKVVGIAPQIIDDEAGLLNRVALVLVLSGQIEDWPWWWELQSEIGVWNPDISLEFKTYYNFEKIDLTLGIYGQGYLGFYGTPAWLNHTRNATGLFISHRI